MGNPVGWREWKTRANKFEARIVELEKIAYVPGLRKCAKCDFSMVSNILDATTGNLYANDKADDCPNGCGPLWRVTERDSGNEMANRLIKAAASSPDDIRAAGWTIAIHNDYGFLGRPHTFWLFTKNGQAVKGEGETDEEALNKVREAIG